MRHSIFDAFETTGSKLFVDIRDEIIRHVLLRTKMNRQAEDTDQVAMKLELFRRFRASNSEMTLEENSIVVVRDCEDKGFAIELTHARICRTKGFLIKLEDSTYRYAGILNILSICLVESVLACLRLTDQERKAEVLGDAERSRRCGVVFEAFHLFPSEGCV